MKTLATLVAIAGLIGTTSAFAADMPVKAAAPAPAAAYNWTGWYAGVNAGASFGSVKTDFNAPVTFAVTDSVVDLGTGSAASTFGFAGSDRTSPDGFIGGGQIGYNWQYSPLIVVGLEADFQGALERDSNTLTNNFSGVVAGNFSISGSFTSDVVGSTTLGYQTKIDWFGTVRGRIGYVWGNGTVMSYLTGGLAYGKVGLDGTSTVSATAGGAPLSFTQAIANSHVNTGWVVGYGTEGVIDFWGARNWTWKIEGLYMDLGHLDTTGQGGFSITRIGTLSAITTNAAGLVTTHSHFTDGILRGGLNYHF